jgi:hypothetical protein
VAVHLALQLVVSLGNARDQKAAESVLVGTRSFVGCGVGRKDGFGDGSLVGDGVGLVDGIGKAVVMLDVMEGDPKGALEKPGIFSVRGVLVESVTECRFRRPS